MIKTWGKIVSLVADAWVSVYKYELKATGLFQDILSVCAFGNFILQQSEDLKTRYQWLQWYDYAIKAYGYYILLPCIAKVFGDDIEKDPNLHAYFYNWQDYKTIRMRILREGEADGEDLEGIADAFRNFFSPIVKGYMEFTGTLFVFLRDLLNSAGYAVWDIAKKQKFNMASIVQTVLQRFKGIGERMRTANIPPEFYYQQRPTLDFDIVTLFAHVQAYIAYREVLKKDVEAEIASPLAKSLKMKILLGNDLIKEVEHDGKMTFNFCLPKDLLDQYKDEDGIMELG